MAPASKKSLRIDKRFVMTGERSATTEQNCGKTRQDWIRLAASLDQTCASNNSPDSSSLIALRGAVRQARLERKHCANHPLANLRHKVEIQCLQSIRGTVIVWIAEKGCVGNHQRGVAGIPEW